MLFYFICCICIKSLNLALKKVPTSLLIYLGTDNRVGLERSFFKKQI